MQNQESKEKMSNLLAEFKSLVNAGKTQAQGSTAVQENTPTKSVTIVGENIWTEIEESEANAGEKNQQIEALLKERKRLQNMLDKKSKEYDEQVTFWKNKYQNIMTQTLELETENSELQEEIIGFTNTIEDLEFTIAQKEHEIFGLKKELERLRNVVLHAADHQKKITQLEEHTMKIQNENANGGFKEQVGMIGKKVVELEASNLNLYGHVSNEEIRGKHENVMAQMHALKSEINQISGGSSDSSQVTRTKDRWASVNVIRNSTPKPFNKYYETNI